jgi:AmmeMemoRadiSam system protein B
MIREPAVAGYFYPGEKKPLERQLSEFLPEREKRRAIGILVPHAGYIYSGPVAGEVFASVDLPQRYMILCPNHTGLGSDFDLYPEGEWETPLGRARIDTALGEELLKRFPSAVKDGRAHVREHSLEVQLPFLQYLKKDIAFLALCVRHPGFDKLEDLGHAMAAVVRDVDPGILIVASSDMTHYESGDVAGRQDRLAIEQMEKVNARGLYDTIRKYDISMCGYLPATAMLAAASDLGAAEGKLVKYANSGDVTGDYDQVVGYAGMMFV